MYTNEELLNCNEMDDHCVSDMRGYRTLRMDNLAKATQNKMCYNKCDILGHIAYIHEIIYFTLEYEEKVLIVKRIQIQRRRYTKYFTNKIM